MKNKKSEQYFVFFLALVFVLPIMLSLFLVMESHKANFEKTIGESAIDLLKTYEKGEIVLNYIDQSSRLALQDAIIDFANKHMDTECDKPYLGRISWGNKKEDCIPNFSEEEIVENIKSRFIAKFNIYMNNFPSGKIPINANDYIIELSQDKTLNLIGNAKIKLMIEVRNGDNIIINRENQAEDYTRNNKDRYGYYFINPSFNQKIDYDLRFFIDVQDKARKLKESFNTYDIITEEIAKDIITGSSELTGVSIGYCNSFSKQETDCMDNNEVPIFSDGKATGDCTPCTNILIAGLAKCKNYYTADFCNKDICNKNCIYSDNECKNKEDVQIESQQIRICISAPFNGISYNENFDSYYIKPISVSFSFNMTNDYLQKKECILNPAFDTTTSEITKLNSASCNENNINNYLTANEWSIYEGKHGPYCGKEGTSYEGYLMSCNDCINENNNPGQDSFAELYSYNCPYGCDTITNKCIKTEKCSDAIDEEMCAKTVTLDNKKCVPYYIFGLYSSCSACPQSCVITDYVNNKLKEENPCNCKVECSSFDNEKDVCNKVIFNSQNACLYYSNKCIQIYP